MELCSRQPLHRKILSAEKLAKRALQVYLRVCTPDCRPPFPLCFQTGIREHHMIIAALLRGQGDVCAVLSPKLGNSCKQMLITLCNSYRSPSPSAIHRASNVATLSSYHASATSPPNASSTNSRKHLFLEWARSPSTPQPASPFE